MTHSFSRHSLACPLDLTLSEVQGFQPVLKKPAGERMELVDHTRKHIHMCSHKGEKTPCSHVSGIVK